MLVTDLDQAFAQPAVDLIKQRWPDLWKEFSTIEPSREIELLEGHHHPSFSLNGIQLASTYDPIAEAKLQTSTIPNDATEVWVYGVGMGYIPRQLLDENKQLKVIYVYILNKALFLGLLHIIDQMDWLADSRIELVLPDLNTTLCQPYSITTPCLWIADVDAYPLRDRLQADLNMEFTQDNWAKKEKQMVAQVLENCEFVRADGDVSDLFESNNESPIQGLTVIVAGAGPTLEDVAEELKRRLAEGAILIAVDAALKPLINKGIYPNVVVSIDPNRDGVIPNFTGDLSSLNKCTLVYFPVVHHDVLASWPFRRLVAYPSSPHSIYEGISKDYPKSGLFSNGSVIHPAVDLAVKMGAKTICLAGADFAFPYGKTHAEGVAHGQSLSEFEGGVAMPKIKNGYERLIPSQINFISYLRDLEQYVSRHPDREFINLSRDGACINGVGYDAI